MHKFKLSKDGEQMDGNGFPLRELQDFKDQLIADKENPHRTNFRTTKTTFGIDLPKQQTYQNILTQRIEASQGAGEKKKGHDTMFSLPESKVRLDDVTSTLEAKLLIQAYLEKEYLAKEEFRCDKKQLI
jgi:hypothetical protein